MFRILNVSRLEERRRELVARSEIHRRTLKLELVNVGHSAALLKNHFGSIWSLRHAVRLAVPLAGAFFGHRRATKHWTGLVGSLLSGMKVARELMPLLRKTGKPFVPAPTEHRN